MEALLESARAQASNWSRVNHLHRGAELESLGRVQQNCPAHGVYLSHGARPARHRLGRLSEAWSPCPTCVELHQLAEAQRDAERRDREHQNLIAERIAAAQIPQRFSGKRLADYRTETADQARVRDIARQYVDRFAANREKGMGLLFAGQPGTGKSLLAMATLQEVCARGYSARYTTLHGMIQTIRRTWGKDGQGRETDVLDEFCSCALLVIDEIGAQLGSESEKTMLFDVIDRRYAEMRPTILATNLDRKGFEAFVEARIWDRLTEMARWVPFKGESYRPQARREMAEG